MSVYPFYTAKDLVYDPGLIGRWVRESDTNEFWQFDPAGGKGYVLTTVDSAATNGLEAHLFRLKQYQFLDLLTTNREEFQLPMHLISKVVSSGGNLSLQFLDYGWLAGLLETNPAVLHHMIVGDKAGDTNNGQMVYLTGETRELQRFLLKHAGDTNAFSPGSAVELKPSAAQ